MSGAQAGLAISVFFACAVEAVEAFTIVLAAGSSRYWSSALLGVAVSFKAVLLEGLEVAFIVVTFGANRGEIPLAAAAAALAVVAVLLAGIAARAALAPLLLLILAVSLAMVRDLRTRRAGALAM